MLQIFPVTFPFFALVLCGYLVTRWRWLPLESIPGLNTFVLYFALPCMLYRAGASTPIGRLLDPGAAGMYLMCAALIVALAVASARRRGLNWNDASFGALVAAFPNSGFMGVPLVVDLLGPSAAGPAIMSMGFDMVVTTSVCVALSRLGAAGADGMRRAVVAALKGMAVNPLPWSILLGGLASATGLALPGPVERTVGMLAMAASPVALFTLGAVLARAQFTSASRDKAAAGPRGWGDVPRLVFLKLVLHPSLVLAAGTAARAAGVPLDAQVLTVLVLVAALPSASNVTMLAERYHADSGRVARIVLLSTAAAFLSFSAVVALVR